MDTKEITDAPATSRLEAGNVLPPGRRAAVTVGIIMGLFLAAIEQTVVATAMPTVVSSLGGLDIYSWVFSIYLLTFTVTVPIWGRLSDVHGRRHTYLISIGLFTLIAKSSKHENAKQPHWAQARSSCWGTRSPPL